MQIAASGQVRQGILLSCLVVEILFELVDSSHYSSLESAFLRRIANSQLSTLRFPLSAIRFAVFLSTDLHKLTQIRIKNWPKQCKTSYPADLISPATKHKPNLDTENVVPVFPLKALQLHSCRLFKNIMAYTNKDWKKGSLALSATFDHAYERDASVW